MKWSYLIWAVWVLMFFALEVPGIMRVVPWRSLSETVWSLEAISPWLKVTALAGLIILTVHIVARWP